MVVNFFIWFPIKIYFDFPEWIYFDFTENIKIVDLISQNCFSIEKPSNDGSVLKFHCQLSRKHLEPFVWRLFWNFLSKRLFKKMPSYLSHTVLHFIYNFTSFPHLLCSTFDPFWYFILSSSILHTSPYAVIRFPFLLFLVASALWTFQRYWASLHLSVQFKCGHLETEMPKVVYNVNPPWSNTKLKYKQNQQK